MRYAVFCLSPLTDPFGTLVGVTYLASDANAMVGPLIAKGMSVSVRSISFQQARGLMALDICCPWVAWNELPGVECLSPEEVRA